MYNILMRVHNGYQTFIKGYIYTFDSRRAGWHIQRVDRGENDFPPILSSLYGYPILSMGCGRWGGKRVLGTFEGCADEVMPRTFVIPDTVEDMYAAFLDSELRVMRKKFKLPKNVQFLTEAFARCKIETIPEKFVIPDGAKNITAMFMANRKLHTIGAGFFVPDSVKYADGMFAECAALTTVPKDFSLSASTTKENLFLDCHSLKKRPRIKLRKIESSKNRKVVNGRCRPKL